MRLTGRVNDALMNKESRLDVDETISICLSCGKPTTKSDSWVCAFLDLSNISRGFGYGYLVLSPGEGLTWQIEQICGGVPLKNCCLWQPTHDACLGYSVTSGKAS